MSARVFPRCPPKTCPASTPLCIDPAVQSRATLEHVRPGCAGCRCFLVALHYRLISVQASPKAALPTGKFETIKNPHRAGLKETPL
jgi:hypothetical protein